ncbi:uncharacterized protein LOC123917709 isoform X6 [Trifolium pratense]|uniref:uncharacterized protein LOC123917709 isoform X6 n=1 Tax=Trifolium pratense TaxID=57577 RepID=UPI001E696C32|nr:uncharacterized protein LOC123917709 isoform X6 [Trifolium pratense]
MVVIMQEQHQHHHHHHKQQQQQQNPSALSPQLTTNHQSSTTVTSLRSPSSVTTSLCSPLHIASHRQPLLPAPVAVVLPSGEPVSTAPVNFQLTRVRLSDIGPYDGAPTGTYVRAMETLCSSLLKYNAALIELGSEDTALMRCGLEGARLFFRSRAHLGVGKGSRGVYMYRAGRALEDWDSSPPCMADIFRCMGKASRVALSAIARHLRLRSDVFNHLLDDAPLPANEVSSSVLVGTYSHASLQNGKGAIGGGKPTVNGEVEKGLLTLISSDTPGLQVVQSNVNKDPSLRSVLSDPLSGSFLEDAMLVSCGHSFGGLTLRRVIETSRCTLCNVDIETGSLIPNLALRAAAAAVKHEDDRRLFRNAALRKRRKEMGEPMDPIRRVNRENGDFTSVDGLQRGVQYPFSVNEKVIIKGNRRTPEKFVGKEAVITSQCLNGWYLLKIIGSGENVRLQYRSLRKLLNTPTMEDQCQLQTVQNSSS